MNSGVRIVVCRAAEGYSVSIVGGTDARKTPYAFAWRHDRYAQIEGRRISFQHTRIILRMIVALRKSGAAEMTWPVDEPHQARRIHVPRDAEIRESVYRKIGIVE